MSYGGHTSYNLDFINLETIVEIQKDIDTSDMISLMFLLYESPKTALKKLAVYQQLATDASGAGPGLLLEWAAQAHPRATWRRELLDALLTCQLHTVVRRLGFSKHAMSNLVSNDKEFHCINPIKKVFYKVCENLDTNSYKCFKEKVGSDNVDMLVHDTCEIVFLELMCTDFFVPDISAFGENIRKLLKVLHGIPTCQMLCSELEAMLTTTRTLELCTHSNSTNQNPNMYNFSSTENGRDSHKNYVQDFREDYEMINETLANFTLDDLKTDDITLDHDRGLCYIINQEKFLNHNFPNKTLSPRPESTADKNILEKTMKEHRVSVTSQDNLSRDHMLISIRNVVNNYLKKHHSVFFLCILSHGSRDHVYSALGERVKITDIEDLLDSDVVLRLRTIPKVLIIQACQTDEIILKTDSAKHYIHKSDMITFCSTAPGYEAFRVKGEGSIFIQSLCKIIQEHSNTEHLTDLFTEVIKDVHRTCSEYYQVDQLPIILRNTLKTKIRLTRRTRN